MGRTTQVRVSLYKGVLPQMATISSFANDKGTITIKWKHQADANSYKVFRQTQTDKGYTEWKQIGTTKDNVFVDSGFKKDTTVKYLVHSVNAKGTSKYNKAKVKTTKYVKPIGSFEVYNSVNGMRIKFAAAEGTVDIYRRLKGANDWVLLGNVSGKEEYIWDPNAKTGKTYEYSAVRVMGKYRSARVSSKAVTFVASPEIKTIKNIVDGINITWSKVDGAEEYRIYRREPGQSKYKYIGTTKKLSYCDKTVKTKTGKTYKYIVRATCKGEISGYREKELVRYQGAEITKVSNIKSGVQVKWGKVSKATEYQVYRRTANGNKWILVGTTKALSFVDKSAKKGVKYNYTVKAVFDKKVGPYDAIGTSIKRV